MSTNSLSYFYNTLLNITKLKSNGNKGDEFENLIKRVLSNTNAICASFKINEPNSLFDHLKNIDQNTYNSLFIKLKRLVTDKNNIKNIPNIFKEYMRSDIYIYIYIYQPFGSQNFPDFLIITNNYIFPLEIKFSTKNSTNDLPKWNSNIPKQNCIYIYANISNQKPIIFLGKDYISQEVSFKLNGYFDNFNQESKIKSLLNDINNLPSEQQKYNPFGLFPKIRTDYLTSKKFVFGNSDKYDIFTFAKNNRWTEHVLNYIKELEQNEKQ